MPAGKKIGLIFNETAEFTKRGENMPKTDMLWFDGDKGTVFDLALNSKDSSLSNGDPNALDKEGKSSYKNKTISHDIIAPKDVRSVDLRL